MRRWLAGLLALAALVPLGGAFAAEDDCTVPTDLSDVRYPLPHVAAALHHHEPLKLVVLGSGSSVSRVGPSAIRVYPTLVAAALAARLPGAKISVADDAAPRLTAEMVEETLVPSVIAAHPDLVIWETGTTDAVHNADLNEFGTSLLKGLHELSDAGIDAVLIDIQYSPQTSALYDFDPYLSFIWRIGDAADVNVLRRYDIMRYYADSGMFEAAAAKPADQLTNANFIHACLARLLADTIVGGIRVSESPAE